MSDRTRNRRLARAGHAVEPKDTPAIRVIGPCPHLLEELDAGFVEALRVVSAKI